MSTLLKDKLFVVYPTYELVIKIMVRLRKTGNPVNVVDVLLEAIAINRDMVVVTNDKDFELIKKVEEKLEIVQN